MANHPIAPESGAATEVRTQQQIHGYFGGWVTGFEKPPADTFGCCRKNRGQDGGGTVGSTSY